MSSRPVIGILLDYQSEGSFSTRPHYALRCGYFDAVWAAGGLPMALPYIADAAQDYLSQCDGLILPGGFYPFPAALYGDPPPAGETVHPRYQFEAGLARRALDADAPTLGICAGMQVIAAEMGATLYRDVRAELPTAIDHLNERPAEETAHPVAVTAGTRLHGVLGVDALDVNTAHKEALKAYPDALVVNAVASDGVVEGIEVPDRRFCLGVQWHPEFFAADGDPNFNLFSALVEAAGDSD
ncbi:MAG: gamma-glutamyl-gamma-aminobutyrate hydrolase family protein [Magnetovibrio sp.]|nr:gamma-glutamyl-gamma-aminobutyrate hydrolase family protein [Magnetovibrio sp.]